MFYNIIVMNAKKILFLFFFICIVLFLWFFVFSKDKEEIDYKNYEIKDYGIVFSYKTGKEGYVLEEIDVNKNQYGHLKSIVLMGESDYLNKGKIVSGEGPAVITLNIFENNKNLLPDVWVNENSQYSNITLKQGDLYEAVVGGEKAIKYMSDGLYMSQNFVVAYKNLILVFNGQFLDQNSQIKSDFDLLIDSIRFLDK